MTQRCSFTNTEPGRMLLDAGAIFVKWSGTGHPVFALNGRRISIPTREVFGSHGENVVAEVRRFIQMVRDGAALPTRVVIQEHPSTVLDQGPAIAETPLPPDEREAEKRARAEARAEAQLAALRDPPVPDRALVLERAPTSAPVPAPPASVALAPPPEPVPEPVVVPVAAPAPDPLADPFGVPVVAAEPLAAPQEAQVGLGPQVCPEPGDGCVIVSFHGGGHRTAHVQFPSPACGNVFGRRTAAYDEHVALCTGPVAEFQAVAVSALPVAAVAPAPANGGAPSASAELRAALDLMQDCLAAHESANALMRDCLSAFARVEKSVAAHERIVAVLRAEGIA